MVETDTISDGVGKHVREWSSDAGYLSTGEAARRLGVSTPTVRRAMRRGVLPLAYRTPAGYARFKPSAVEAFSHRLARPLEECGEGSAKVIEENVSPSPEESSYLPHAAVHLVEPTRPDDALTAVADCLHAILDVSSALTTVDDEEELLALIAASACHGLGFGSCMVSVRDAAGDFRRRATAGLASEQDRLLHDHTLSSAGFAALRDAATAIGPILYIPSDHPIQEHPAVHASIMPTQPTAPMGAWQASSILIVPLVDLNGDVLGFLNPDDPLDGQLPGQSQAAVLDAFAHLAVVALQVVRGRAVERVRAQRAEVERRQLAGLLQAMTSVRGSLRLDEVLQQITSAMTSGG